MAASLLPLLLLMDRGRHTEPFQAEWLPAGDTHVRALRTGGGDTTVLLFHGYGESLLAFRGLLPALADRFRVVAVDLPGSGLSGKPEGPYTLAAMTARMNMALDDWIAGPVVLVGHSMGGAIAADLAIRRPDRIVAVVLIAPAGQGLGFSLDEKNLAGWQRNLTAWTLQARKLIVPMEDELWLRNPPGLPDEAMSDSAAREANSALLRDLSFTELQGRFGEVAQPALVIWGGLDPLIPPAIGHEIVRQMPHARLVEISNSWHRPHVEHPGRVSREIMEFLDRLSRRPTTLHRTADE